jgi:hypothetical protein
MRAPGNILTAMNRPIFLKNLDIDAMNQLPGEGFKRP